MRAGAGRDPGTGTGGGTPGHGAGALSSSRPAPPAAGGAWVAPREPTPRVLVAARITTMAAWVLLGTPSAVLVHFLVLALSFLQGPSAPWGGEEALARIESRIVAVALLGLAVAVGATVGVFVASSSRIAWRCTAVAGAALASPMVLYAVLALMGPA